MEKRKELPISIQSFNRIISEGYVYVDKTEYIHDLAKSGKLYFLSRPRRFGKSLLVSTLKCLFEAEKALFKGLWIDSNSDWEWSKYPVILLDFNEMASGSTDELTRKLNLILEETALPHGIELQAPFADMKFRELILKLKEKTGRDVVVLVDEYDKPVIDFIGKGEENLKIARRNRDFMKRFYGTFKGAKVADVLRFVLITGVSTFTRVSIFSELNNLDDLTMQERYAGILGYTHEELIFHFRDRIDELAGRLNLTFDETIDMLGIWYHGFRFSDSRVKVYNPVSILKALNELSLGNYWFETGSPSFLINLLKEKDYFLPDLERIETSRDVFSTYDIEKLAIEPILFQTGYLTIKEIRRGGGKYSRENIYILSYPNEEVRMSLSRHLFVAWSDIDNGRRSGLVSLSRYLQEERFDDFFDTITSLFAGIPYTLSANRDEAYFHSLFYLMICASGIYPHNEMLTSKGRIDMLLEFSENVFVIEFKCGQGADMAIKQIIDKGYAEKYKGSKKKIFLMGIDFSKKDRNVREWKIREQKMGEIK